MQLTNAEAIKSVNSGKTVKNDTADGYVTIRRKAKGVYEIKVFTNGVAEPTVMNGNVQSLMKTLNRYESGWQLNT
ncbi:hypothetical protein [Brevibacillus sp. NRS-1366]|uniref:hypothetical protein n=1 Tax=Brevibacillus sp. NRS-1366 TaxID=3233899 RepID=UPI003D1E8CBB